MLPLSKIWICLATIGICQALICYECNNARSDEECRKKGKVRLCGENQESCQTTERIDYAYGPIVKITKRCKQARACQNNYRQNIVKKEPQCRYFKHMSVCRCCCIDDLCNFNTDTCTGVIDPKLLREDPLVCKRLPRLRRGVRLCDNENRPGSKCYFRCNKFYDMRGPPAVNCILDERRLEARWSEKMPCCSKPCPPHGNMDLILGVDSSLESEEDWLKVKELLKSLIRSFVVGPQDSRMGIVPYNEKVGDMDEIFLSSYNTTNSLAEAINFLPRHPGKSKGTRIGQLLEHVNKVSLTPGHGNRRNVRDILIILTSGAPLKEKQQPQITAKLMRDNGIEVITVGVGRYVDIKQLQGTAGLKKRVVRIPGGVDTIGETKFRDQIMQLICGSSCTRR